MRLNWVAVSAIAAIATAVVAVMALLEEATVKPVEQSQFSATAESGTGNTVGNTGPVDNSVHTDHSIHNMYNNAASAPPQSPNEPLPSSDGSESSILKPSNQDAMGLIVGKWHGTYLAGQGLTGLDLTISKIPGGLEAEWEFGPIEQNPSIPHGIARYAQVTFSPTERSMSLSDAYWKERPINYVAPNVSGYFSADYSTFEGRLLCSGCGAVSVTRAASGSR